MVDATSFWPHADMSGIEATLTEGMGATHVKKTWIVRENQQQKK
jgi:hypothetical protein